MRRQKINKQNLLTTYFLLILSLLFVACDEEDNAFPSTILNYAEFATDSQGRVSTMTLDDGLTLKVSPQIDGLHPDTIYRYIVAYTQEAGTAYISSKSQIFSSKVSSFNEGEVFTDPIVLQSIWKTSRYINLNVKIKTNFDAKHLVGFADKGVKENANGTRTQMIELYHYQSYDLEAFSQTTYLSCPIYDFSSILRTGMDSISFRLNDYVKGTQTYTYLY